MKIKQVPFLALMLCMGALFLSVTAHAAAPDDKTPPTVSVRLDGDLLRAEAFDQNSGVEAVYVNGHRIGFLVDGAIEASLDEVAGDGEHITVHAVDFAGNKSREVKLENPHYTAPAATSTSPPMQTTPAPTPVPAAQNTTPPAATTPQASAGGANTQPPAAPQPSTTAPPASASAADDGPESTESSIPDSDANPFTPDGTGSVQDNAVESDGKEFFTIVTEAENTFYLIVDRQRDSNGVYLLNAVTEDDLMALAETSGNAPSETVIPNPVPDPEPEPTPEPEPVPEPEPEPEPASGNSMGTILFIVIAALAVGGAGYYFKIMKPRQQAAFDSDEEEDEPDEYGEYDGDPEEEDDYDFSDDYTEILEADSSDESREDGDAQ